MFENFSQLAGLGGLTLIRQIIKMVGLKGIWAVLASLSLGIIVNFAFAIYAGNDLKVGVAMGIMTGLLANFYEDVKR